jgi:hypothetical protein
MPLLWLGTIVGRLVSMSKLALMCYQGKWQSWADIMGGGGLFWAIGGSPLSPVGMRAVLNWQVPLVSGTNV